MDVSTNPLKATVAIDSEPLHTLPKTQYGHFIEHLGMCIKGGIWAEGESADMFLGGVRRELVKAVKSINPALIRYPGGCFADGYHWQDGIGPRDGRPLRKNRAWAKFGKRIGPIEDNHFGTDEFLQFCEEVGAAPQLTANVGSGTAEEASAWVEYCNGAKDTRWGKKRAENGHPEPYRVKYWYVGNEIFGFYEIGHQKPAEYINTVKRYAAAMRKVDPDIKLIACGNLFPGWIGKDINKIVLQGAGEAMDYLSIHQYVPYPLSLKKILNFDIAKKKGSGSRNIYYDIIGSYQFMKDFVEQSLREVRSYSPPGRQVPVCFDEWNLWLEFFGDIFICNYNLRDGLWVATMLNYFHSIAPEMPLANIAQMVNCIGIINSTKKGTFLTPSALVYRLYTEHAGEGYLASSVDCPRIPHETELPAMDISATKTGNKISLFIVNRHYDAEIIADCALKGLAVEPTIIRHEITHPNPVQYNTFDDPNTVGIRTSNETLSVAKEGSGSRFQLRLPPHSINCFELKTTS